MSRIAAGSAEGAEQRQESSGKERTVGLLLVLLVALMTCVFSAMGTAEVTLTNSGKSSGNDPSAAIGGTFLIAETACRFWQGPAGAAKNRPLCKDSTGDGFFDMEGVRRPEFQTSARLRRR